jgi:hypothetical protein
MLKEHIRMQLDEAFGPVNRWYCSEHHGYEVRDRETLLRYYIQHGGAEGFAKARSPLCSKTQSQNGNPTH